jgi:hypothetical protein
MTDQRIADSERAYAAALVSATGYEPWQFVVRDAAASINRCCAEIERLRAALTGIDTELWGLSSKQPKREPQAFVDALKRIEAIARQALGGDELKGLQAMVALDEEIEAGHPGWMTGNPAGEP